MKMKKIIALAAVAVMAFTFAACGNGGSQDSQAAGDNTSAPTEAQAPEETGGVLVMATNAAFPPYEYVDGNDYVGIDVEIAGAIAKELGMELQIDDMDFDSIVTSVQTGKADIGVAGMTVTEDRLKNVNFSDSYATGVQVIIVTEDSDIASPDDLDGKMIGVQQGTTGHIYCADTPENGGYGEENVIAYPNGASAVEALKNGKVDCVVIDNEPAKAFVAANENLKILETEFVTEEYAIAIAKENTELLEKVNASLTKLKEDGTLQEIIDKYIKAE